MRLWITTSILLAAAAGAAADELLPLSEPPPSLTFNSEASIYWAPAITAPMSLDKMVLRDFLTLRSVENDRDKDGFVEGGVAADANPVGYVVFHYSDWRMNARISLGQDWMGFVNPPPVESHGGVPGGSHAAPYLASPTPGEPPAPQIPEPSLMLLLGAGGLVAMRRRRGYSTTKTTASAMSTAAPASSAHLPSALPSR